MVAVSRQSAARTDTSVRWAQADATDAGSVRKALAGAEAAFYLVHSLGAANFAERDHLAATTVAAEADRAGLRQIVYLGGLGDDSPALSPHLRSRSETGSTLASGTTPVTTLRAAMVVGRGSAAFETIAALVRRLPAMVMPRWVTTPTQPIALDDVVAYLSGVCGVEAAYGAGYDVGGPDVMTYLEMIERIAAVLGRRPLIVRVPVLTPRLSSYWLHLVTPVKAGVARPLIEGLRIPTTARDEAIRAVVPLELTSFDDAARHALRPVLDGGRTELAR